MSLIVFCAALAIGEFAGSFITRYCEAWPIFAMIAASFALFGYGFGVKGWQYGFAFFLGVTLFFVASVESEQQFREQPWMRNRWERTSYGENNAFSGVRDELSRRIGIGLDSERDAVALNRAILLGERKALPKHMKQAFVESGTMHVFAISGLHVMAVASLLSLIMRLLMVPRRWIGVFALPFLWAYIIIIGYPPSAVRAAIMATFYLMAPIFWRRPDALRAWALTFLLVYIGKPTMITNVGAALSFIVVLSIILAGRYSNRFKSRIVSMIFVTFSAWAAGVPIAAHVFGRVTPGGICANLLLVPVAGVTVVTGMLGMLISFISETLAAYFNNLSALFTDGMVVISETIAGIPGANLEVGKWSLLQCAEWYLVILLILFWANLREKRELFR